MAKTLLAITGFCLFIGILTVAIFVAGAILGVVLSFMVPVALLFTGVGLIGFMMKDFSDEKPETKQ